MTRRSVRTRFAVAAAALVASATMTGCGPTFGDLPLPGKGVSGDTIEMRAEFDEALNLATGATVKVNGITVGKVQEVTVKDFRAQVELLIRKSAQLRQGATARLRYTTPLGELFVDITNPEEGELLPANTKMGTDVTATAPTVEDALASASLLVNGGGLAQLGQVTKELNTALNGREETVKQTFRKINTFLTQANASTAQIDAVLSNLAAVSTILKDREETINKAITDFRPAARVLRENTAGFTNLLKAVTKLTGTANNIARQSRDQLLQVLRDVDPILAEFLSLQADFGPGLADIVRLGKALDRVVPGDYLNLNGPLDLDALQIGGTPLPLPTLPPILPPLPGLGGLIPSLPLDLPLLSSPQGSSTGLSGLLGGLL